jgi:hypothetical protein
MFAASNARDGTALTVKQRNPVERAFVRGLIVVLLVLTIVEFWSRNSYQRAYNSLGDRLTVADERGFGALDAADVKAHFGGREPSRTEVFAMPQRQVVNGASHLEVYSWFTLNPFSSREIYVYYDFNGPARKAHPQVISIHSAEEEIVSYASLVPTQGDERMMRRMQQTNVPHLNFVSGIPGWPAAKPVLARGEPPQVEKQSDAINDTPADQAHEGNQQRFDDGGDR